MKKTQEAAGEKRDCPVRKALHVLGGKWKLLIISEIGGEVRRYSSLRRQIPEITERMLIRELKSLAEEGLLEKKSFGEVPPRVEYSLTEKGRLALKLVDQLACFGAQLAEEQAPVSAPAS